MFLGTNLRVGGCQLLFEARAPGDWWRSSEQHDPIISTKAGLTYVRAAARKPNMMFHPATVSAFVQTLFLLLTRFPIGYLGFIV